MYADRKNYRKLYSRYLTENGRPISELMDLAGDLKGKVVVDLCGGAGEMALEALERGATKSVMVDECRGMPDWNALKDSGVRVISERVEVFLDLLKGSESKTDVVFCRQAVNYWLTDKTASSLAKSLNPEMFIFNTFNKKPNEAPTTKEYQRGTAAGMLGGDPNWSEYVEVSWLVGDLVHHVQCREGMKPHVTSFRWISPEQYREWLTPWFEVEERKDGKSSLYICKKRS